MVDVLVSLRMCHLLADIRNLELKNTQLKKKSKNQKLKIESHMIQINKEHSCFECMDLSNSTFSSGNQCA